MSIKKSLKNLITAMGGTPTGKKTEDLIDEIVILKDPLFSLAFDADIDEETDLLGKVVGDLQERIKIKDNVVSGTLFYVDDYTGFSGDTSLQSGNYLVVHAEVPNTEDVTVTVTNSQSERTVNLDEDGILIFRVTGTNSTITFTASKSGLVSCAKTLKLSGLTLKEASE